MHCDSRGRRLCSGLSMCSVVCLCGVWPLHAMPRISDSRAVAPRPSLAASRRSFFVLWSDFLPRARGPRVSAPLSLYTPLQAV